MPGAELRRIALVLAALVPAPLRADVTDFDLRAVPADGQALAQARSDAEFALAGLKASREALRRARYHLDEDRVEGDGASRSVFKIAMDVAFDLDAHLYRVDFSQTEPLPQPLKFTYVEDSSIAHFYNHQGILTRVNPGYLNNHAFPPIDVSTIGAGLYYDYVARRGGAGKGVDSLKDAILGRARLVGVRRDGGSMLIDFFSDDSRTSRYHFVLDESRDFVPLRMETIVLAAERGQWRNEQKTETTWTRVKDIWLPEKVTSSLESPRRQLTLRFRWSSVNEPLDGVQFAKESLKLPSGTYLADMTIKPDRSILVDVVGRKTGADYMKLRDRTGGWSARWVLGLNLVFAIVVVAYAIRIRGARDAAADPK